MNAIFGYGSLINPLSMEGRDTDYNNINERYDEEIRLKENWNVCSQIDSFIQLYNNGLDIYPVKIKGYKRYYSVKHRCSGMLEVCQVTHE